MKWEEAIELFRIPKMYIDASLEDSDFIDPRINALGKKWVNARNRPSLVISGCVGCGKTYFITAIFKQMTENGWNGLIFRKSGDLDQELLEASKGELFSERGFKVFEKDLINRYSECPILFIDDLGCEKGTERILQQYYTIIDRRTSSELPTVITTNLTPENISLHLGERIASRLRISITIQFPDLDLRKKIKPKIA